MGWIPTAPDMSRGCSTFMVRSQPTAITTSTGSTISGLKSSATSTGGTQDMNGPKNGTAWRSPETKIVTAA